MRTLRADKVEAHRLFPRCPTRCKVDRVHLSALGTLLLVRLRQGGVLGEVAHSTLWGYPAHTVGSVAARGKAGARLVDRSLDLVPVYSHLLGLGFISAVLAAHIKLPLILVLLRVQHIVAATETHQPAPRPRRIYHSLQKFMAA